MTTIIRTSDFNEWLEHQSLKTKVQISARIFRIQVFDHLGDYKHLQDGLLELRWKSGLRIYFAIERDQEDRITILILGGNKGSQKKDIRRSLKILKTLTGNKNEN